MRPILFVVPQLPQTWLLPLIVVALLVGAMIAWRVSRVAVVSGSSTDGASSPDAMAPLLGAVAVSFGLWILSRNPITLHSYGLMLVIGFGVAAWLSCREAERRGIDPNIILDLALPLLFWSILACRVLYVVQWPSQFDSLAAILRIWDGGLSFHGSLVAAPLVVWFYARKNKLGFGQLADCIAVNAFFGYSIARLGCLFNGCCYGGVCDLSWAMQFPSEENRSLLTPPSHPAQLYSSIMALGLFFVMQSMKNKPQWSRFSGQLTLIFFALYAVERFIMEIFRNGATAPTAFGQSWLTRAQLVSVIGLIVIAALWLLLSKRASTRTSLQPPVASL